MASLSDTSEIDCYQFPSLTTAHLSSGDIAGLVTTVVLVVGIVASVCTATAILVLHRNKVKYSSTTEPPSKEGLCCKLADNLPIKLHCGVYTQLQGAIAQRLI